MIFFFLSEEVDHLPPKKQSRTELPFTKKKKKCALWECWLGPCAAAAAPTSKLPNPISLSFSSHIISITISTRPIELLFLTLPLLNSSSFTNSMALILVIFYLFFHSIHHRYDWLTHFIRDLISFILTGIVEISLDRPESKNAIGKEMLRGLNQAFELINQKSYANVAMISSSVPGVFCAGADLKVNC